MWNKAIYIKKKKDISRLLSLKHNTAGEKFGVVVKKKIWEIFETFFIALFGQFLTQAFQFRPFDIDFIKKKNSRMKKSLQKINIGSLVTTTQAELRKPTLYAIPPRSVIFVSFFFVRTMNKSASENTEKIQMY